MRAAVPLNPVSRAGRFGRVVFITGIEGVRTEDNVTNDDDAHTRAERLYMTSHSRVTRFLALVWLRYHNHEEAKIVPLPPHGDTHGDPHGDPL